MKIFLKDLGKATKWSMQSFTELPWRAKRSFYHTLVSEIMLQQTTVSTVKNRFENFIVTYPSLKSLGEASEDELLKMWQGLGYYNRARRLKAAAQVLAKFKQSQFTVDALLKISGIGDYTANALVAIGLNQAAFAVDVNLERVLMRYFEGIKSREHLKEFLNSQLKNKIQDFRAFHETLMDVGRVFCQARARNCLQCPLNSGCVTFKTNIDQYEKVKVTKVRKSEVVEMLRLVVMENKKIFLVQRKKDQWLAGQWEVPSLVLKGKVAEKQYEMMSVAEYKEITKFKTTITHHIFNNVVANFKIQKIKKWKVAGNGKWFSKVELAQLPITSVTKKVLKSLLLHH